MECYMAQFRSFDLYMPVLTRRKINTDYTLIDYVDFEEPPEIEIDEVFWDETDNFFGSDNNMQLIN